MSRVEDLAAQYGRHIKTPWQRTIAGAQRVVMVVYDKELERTLRARKLAFETATREASHGWHEVDISSTFGRWLAQEDYRESFFQTPKDLQTKLEEEFPEYVAQHIRETLTADDVTQTSVVAIFGAGTMFGLTRVSHILKLVEPDIRGRLVVFFPGQHENNAFRLLDGRAGWNYLAVPITLHGGSAV